MNYINFITDNIKTYLKNKLSIDPILLNKHFCQMIQFTRT